MKKDKGQKKKMRLWKKILIIAAAVVIVLAGLLWVALYFAVGCNATIACDFYKNLTHGTSGYKFYTNSSFLSSGPAFTMENCFDEQTGEYRTVELSYALYVPDDYDPSGSYALVTIDNPATNPGAHPFESVITSRSPQFFASDKAQQMVKDLYGLDGIIAVVPTILERVGDNASAPAEYTALVGLWDYLQEEYSIDPDHVYGLGQSVGGMVLLETNTKRDNYFAGILLYDDQWGQNYYKDEVFVRNMAINYDTETAENTPRTYPNAEGVEWDYYWGDDGEKVYENVDTSNYYYMVSDDNILIMNSSNNYLSNDVWQEQNLLYSDLVGYTIPRFTGLDHTAPKAEQNETVSDFLSGENSFNGQDMGIWWITFDGGSSMTTAVWSRALDAPFEWLLSQSRESEMERAKLDINRPFEGELIRSEDRVVQNFYDLDTGEPVYYWTAKAGSGTQFYNTSWLNIQMSDENNGEYAYADKEPGWLPDGMTFPVEKAEIQSVTCIRENGVIKAAAIEYNTDMSDAVIWLKGDQVLDSHGVPRTDDFVKIDAFELRDTDNNAIAASILNVYMNDVPETVPGAERGSGSGKYIIVEFDTDWSAKAGIIQLTTIRTNNAIAEAHGVVYE